MTEINIAGSVILRELEIAINKAASEVFYPGDEIINKDPYEDEPSYIVDGFDWFGYKCFASDDKEKIAAQIIPFDEAFNNYERVQ